MENYKKGKNVEEPLEKNNIPFKDLPENFLWMQVRGGSKIRNLLTHALEEFPKVKYVVWTGFGQSVGKTVSCAEIMKKKMGNNLHQITRICYRLVEEYWDPMLDNLDQLVVKRKLPMIHILLSSETLNSNESGYQAPGCRLWYDPEKERNNKFNNQNKHKNKRPQNQNRKGMKSFNKKPNKNNESVTKT